MGQSQPLSRHPVLIIEDEPILRIEAIDMVEHAGFEAVEATNIEDAIHILETRTDIRIVYMDLDMPRSIKGIEIAAAIRDRWPPIEIILTAASFSKADLDLPVRTVFFSKPVRHREIVAAMRRMANHAAH
ncbi:histidine kinase [Sphingomonas melonis TY]|uniref:Histidine kinase n=1 Tax=Sphingomonas melonis TY TaxID=621456 RepID=A0A175Y339_9SPHN|nr:MULTISPECIES: response regulator [Sphingomonas]AOW25676.1 response regulator [Sphingomonas melonis TY]AOW25694.1 response regulator [Sphingomonas melonis TY]KZB95087.1 histidine kinase [Sphingomonas melonis TY]